MVEFMRIGSNGMEGIGRVAYQSSSGIDAKGPRVGAVQPDRFREAEESMG